MFLGITVDSEDILLVSVKDSMKNPNAVEKEDPPPESDNEDAKSVVSSKSSRKRGKKRRQSSNNDDDDDGGGDHDAISEPKTPRNDSDYDTNSLLATPNTSRTAPAASAYSGADDSRTSFGNQSGEGFTLTEMKQDYEDDDDDLVEFIKEEPGYMRPDQDGSHVVSIQQLPGGPPPPGMPGLSPMPGLPMPGMVGGPAPPPPVQMGDLNEVSVLA